MRYIHTQSPLESLSDPKTSSCTQCDAARGACEQCLEQVLTRMCEQCFEQVLIRVEQQSEQVLIRVEHHLDPLLIQVCEHCVNVYSATLAGARGAW